jgi:secreted trypsin-like serine protease
MLKINKININYILGSQNNFPTVEAIYGVHARPAFEGEFPSLAILMHYNSTTNDLLNNFCTGALITPFHVLTAAHCFDEINSVHDFKILIGTIYKSTGRERRVTWVMSYNQWMINRNLVPQHQDNDVGIARVKYSLN